MPPVNRARRAARSQPAAEPLLEPLDTELPASIAAITEVADRNERKRLLSDRMRRADSTGAEVVAAGRMLEAMERADAGSDTRGLPPPTNHAEQTARLVRLLTAAGNKVMLAALEIVATRAERGRRTVYLNRANGVNPMALPKYREFKSRLLGPKYNPEEDEDDGGEPGDSKRPLDSGSGEIAGDAGMRDVRELAAAAEQVAEPAQSHGERAAGADEAGGERRK